MRKILAVLIAAALICSLIAVAAFAETEVDLKESTDGMLKIEEAGTYTLTGEMEGTVYVDPGEGDVTLILDGVDIDGGENAGIAAVSGDSLHITLADGSVNRVVGAGTDCVYGGAIFTMADATFDGSGTIYIASSGKSGICSRNADLVFEDGVYTIGAAEYGLAADGSTPGQITINGGTFNIEAQATVSPLTTVVYNGGAVNDLTDSTAGQTAGNAQTADAAQTSGSGSNAGTAQTSDTGSNAGTAQTSGTDSSQASQPSGEMQPGGNRPSGEMQPGGNQSSGEMRPGGGQPSGEMQPGGNTEIVSAESPTEIVTGTTTNSAAELEADTENATYLMITDTDNEITISSSGTYVVSGTCSDGNITVKKGTTGVVLVLENLDLTSTTGATVSVNKNAEVKIIIQGEVVLTDNENPEDENSEDADVADAYDGAALKAKADSDVYVTGDGTLVINGNAKNGIKGGDDSTVIFDGVTVNITAVNDGINSNYDVTLLSGSFTISAGDDAIHADHIVTVGSEDGTGPVINVTDSYEGIEGTVVNICGGDVSVVSEDDAINAANSDGTYEDETDYSINILGGNVTIKSSGDGLDSNGNINLIDGSATISSASAGGEAGIDYDGQLYVSDDFELNNNSGVSGADSQPGDMGQGGQSGQGGQGGQGGQSGQGGQPGDMGQGGQSGQPGGMNQNTQPSQQGNMGQNSQPAQSGAVGQDTQSGVSGNDQNAPQSNSDQMA